MENEFELELELQINILMNKISPGQCSQTNPGRQTINPLT